MAISLKQNPAWMNEKTRPASKYTPVMFPKVTPLGEKAEMLAIVERRIASCQRLALVRNDMLDTAAWFSFRHDQMRERNLRPHNVPIFVLSGGNAQRIKQEFEQARGYTLAWHPATARNEPVYLFVHNSDYNTYRKTLSAQFGQYRNLFLVGWDGGQLTGFGAARAAVLSYADCLPYAPQRLIMMDQDVVATEMTRPSSSDVTNKVLELHRTQKKPVIGYGVGFPKREAKIPSTSEQLTGTYTRDLPKGKSVPGEVLNEQQQALSVKKKDLPARNSTIDFAGASAQPSPSPFAPTQQFVSIKAPFRKKNDGIYPAFMVAGGEDMLMTQLEKLQTKNAEGIPTANPTVRNEKIFKKALPGEADAPNIYWSEKRIKTLDELFKDEEDTQVSYEGGPAMKLKDLCQHFVAKGYIKPAEVSGTAALIIERIILKANQVEGAWPEQYDGNILNRFA
ncbi:hypothetical protein [Massilia sp. TSP1-1-2]|uniref:hypothetical protein n=1 Tax=Massilia sp. TSP1-1-2 TaxID=2804649 RepID=UPI003CF99417